MNSKMQPFPNGSSMGDFYDSNCHSCKKYKYEPEDSCPMDVEIGLAYFGDGEISVETARRIGWSGDGYINAECKEKEAL